MSSVPVCEMCGKEVSRLIKTKIEGAILMVGPECTRFGIVVASAQPQQHSGGAVTATPQYRIQSQRHLSPPPRRDALDEGDLELALDYPERIRNARSALGWKQEELAAKINEKKSVVKDLEAGDLVPDNNVILKLEKVLKIVLLEKKKEGVQREARKQAGAMR
ncbi:MAG: multiprotein bridging factor aMBF1 [Methanomassiliicoccales archaeon]